MINPIEGRWNMVISQNGKELPSWLEIRHSGTRTLVGRFVYAMGSARPISEISMKDDKFTFSIPPQWEDGNRNMEFSGVLDGDVLSGTMVYTDGKSYEWEAVRAPKLEYIKNPKWGKPQNLINENDLNGWHALGKNQWSVESGILKSPRSGANLVSDEKFQDFKLHLEFRYPEGSNSGVYLRGRYEVQITDSKGADPSDIEFSGIYGFLTPSEVVAKEAMEWQEYDITLIGRRVTVVANGVTVIKDQIIPGITGGALDSREGEPGPLLLQGDHGPIEFRNIVITPRVE
ncbi:large multifunctional protein- glycosyl hydrolase [Arenibacter certesii]|uniref:Large multifunctional protein- glycosyl hydrolase n=2 Tax=Arenibacter certesii TaxID=228955 RepID=A0A918MR63_9FLAO|nr:large multifunctional protein- glycosyl hydrolase [Arenibacter certesii]